MFSKLKIKHNGMEIEFAIHEVVYIALELMKEMQVKQVPLNFKEVQSPPLQDLQTDANPVVVDKDKKFIHNVAQHIVPASIQPLKSLEEWLFVARNIKKLTNKQVILLNINGKIIGIRSEDCYASDYGSIQSIARNLFDSVFLDNWQSEGLSKAHEAMEQIIKSHYESGKLHVLAEKSDKLIRDSSFEEYRNFAKKLYPDMTEEEIQEEWQDLQKNDFTKDFIPEFLIKKQSIDTTRAIAQHLTLPLDQKDIEDEHKLKIIEAKAKAIQDGDVSNLPRANDAFQISLNSLNPNKVDFNEALKKIAKGSSYQKFEEAINEEVIYIDDEETARIIRKIISGEKVENCQTYIPNLVAAWFISETSRNEMTLLSNLILLDFMQNRTKYIRDGFNLYEFNYILRNPYVGERGKTISSIYGKGLGPDEWGGMHPMALDGSYKQGSEVLEIKQSKSSGKMESKPLSMVRQKEGSLILNWLYCAFQHFYPEIKVELIQELLNHDQNFSYEEVMLDNECPDPVANSGNSQFQRIQPSKDKTIAFNKLIRKVNKKQAAKEELTPLELKQKILIELIKPLLKLRLSSCKEMHELNIPNYYAVKTNKQDNLFATAWYSEDIVNTALKAANTENAIIMSQTQLEHANLLEENLRQAVLQSIATQKPALIPIHLHDNHWVAMVVKKQNINTPIQVIYNDSLGNALESELKAATIITIITSIDPQAEIIDLRLPQQTNGYDCGPFMVDNLIRLSRQSTQGLSKEQIQKLLLQPHSGSAAEIRKDQHKLLGNITEDQLQKLYETKAAKAPTDKTPRPKYNYEKELTDILWKILPNSEFVEKCICSFKRIESSLVSKNKKFNYPAKKFLIALLEGSISAYERDKNVEQSEICKVELKKIQESNTYKLNHTLIKVILIQFTVQLIIQEKPFSELMKKHLQNKKIPVLLLILRGAAMLDSKKENLSTQFDTTQSWVLDVLMFFKGAQADEHFKRFESYIKYAGLNICMTALAQKAERLNLLCDQIMKDFDIFIEGGILNQKQEVIALIEQLKLLMEKVGIQSDILYKAFVNQLKQYSTNRQRFTVEIVMNFIMSLKYIEILQVLKQDLNQAMLEDKEPKSSDVLKSPSESKDVDKSSSIKTRMSSIPANPNSFWIAKTDSSDEDEIVNEVEIVDKDFYNDFEDDFDDDENMGSSPIIYHYKN